MSKTKIEWTQATWNPVTGCTKISAGCAHCYAERFALRLQAAGHPRYRNGFRVTIHEDLLEAPLRWRKPRLVFVNSMSDLFHPEVPDDFIVQAFGVMLQAPQHTFQVLTKRPERLISLNPVLPWPPNVWMGVTVESADYLHRVDILRRCNARVKFLSLEPLLGPIRLDLQGIDWVIVGAETGPGARPMKREWAIRIRDQCLSVGVPFFFKRWASGSRLLDGVLWQQMPEVPGRSGWG